MRNPSGSEDCFYVIYFYKNLRPPTTTARVTENSKSRVLRRAQQLYIFGHVDGGRSIRSMIGRPRYQPIGAIMNKYFLAVVGLILACGTALAQGVTLGQNSVGSTFCAGAQIFVQISSSGTSYAAPADGVITSWSFSSPDDYANSQTMVVLRPLGGTSYSVVAVTAIQSVAEGLTGNFPVNIPVEAGDVIALYSSGSRCLANTGDTFGIAASIFSAPTIGQVVNAPAYNFIHGTLNLQATFTPGAPASVPAMNTAGMILLLALMAGSGYFLLRKRAA
jgi:hypothetical protein